MCVCVCMSPAHLEGVVSGVHHSCDGPHEGHCCLQVCLFALFYSDHSSALPRHVLPGELAEVLLREEEEKWKDVKTKLF